MEYARKLRDDRGRGNIVVIDDGEETEQLIGSDEFRVLIDSCFAIARCICSSAWVVFYVAV